MAVNKDKLLESAQKNLKKKQVAKAIKDYLRIVELDPADVRSRQKLAELYVRTHKSSEAYEQYESVAKYFSSNGFYLKAIAIYRQMQRLDPSQISIFNRLAELNEKQGLLGNAMTEYRNLVDYYARNGMVADEIKTLEKMRELDLDNLNIRIKLAEVYARNERQDEGLAELEEVLEILSEKRQFDKILRLYKMFLPLYPNHKKMQMGLALAFYEKNDYVRGVTILETLLKEKPQDPDLLRLLGRGYSDVQNWPKARHAFQQLLSMDPTDLDIREALIKCELDSGRFERALAELEEWKDTFFKADRLDQLKRFYETLKEELADNSAVLETLDSIYELTGEGEKLLDIISETEEDTEEPVLEETLSDLLLGSAESDFAEGDLGDSAAAEEEESFLLYEDDNLDLELVSAEEDFAVDSAGTDTVIELDIDDDFDLGQDEDVAAGLAFDLGDEDGDKGDSGAERNLRADLEEAEFYLQQGLYAEAEKLCRDILAYAPDSEECLTKLREVETLRSEAEAGAGTASGEGVTTGDDLSALDLDFNLDVLQPADKEAEKKIFKTDVDEQIAADDMESHYNLGIAYREMGLFEDAISEFAKAEREPARYVDCLMLEGLCYSDQQDYGNAEKMFQQALDSQYLEEIQRLNLGYELGLLYERAERADDALASYQTVMDLDSNYRDIVEKVSSLRKRLGLPEENDDKAATEIKERISFL